MTTRQEIMEHDFIVIGEEDSPVGVRFVASFHKGMPRPVAVIADGACDPKFFHLLSASRMMFGALEENAKALQAITDRIEEGTVTEAKQLLTLLTAMQNQIMLAQQCAIDGLVSVAERTKMGNR